MAWAILFAAGCFEVVWAVTLKYTDGFTRLWPSVLFGISAWLSFTLLSQALKFIPLGSAYAVWTGVGAVGVAIVGIVFLGEPASALRILCIGLIVAGIVGLKLISPTG
ncbi:MAG: quaternary ammonium compound efflux SMR transporter SugE [Pseudomonadota bacterium]